MPKEATTATQPGDAPQTRTAKARAISRVTAPYLAAAVFAASAMAWYFFSFVPGKLDYFVGLRFRALAVASAQVTSKAENLARALASAVNPPVPPKPTIDAARQYLSLLVPDIQLALEPGAVPSDDAVLRLSVEGAEAAVAWEDVVRAAALVSARDFYDLILADSEGKTLWQREKTTPRIGNLKTLLSVEPEPSGWLTTSWQMHRTKVKEPPDPMQPIPVLASIDFGGESSYLFVQSVSPAAKGIGIKPRLYLAGVVSRRLLERQAMHIPIVWIVLFALPVVLLFLALPFIKLATLTPKERYSFADVALLGFAAVAAVSIGAILPFGPAVIDSSVDETLGRFASTIERRFAAETSKVLDLADALQAHDEKLAAPGTCDSTPAPDKSTPAAPQPVPAAAPVKKDLKSVTMGCELWQALEALKAAHAQDASLAKVAAGSVELDVVAWLDRYGQQVRKWTTKSVATAPVSHRPYAHFRDLEAGHTRRLADPSLNQVPFTLEPLRTPTTAQMGFVFAVRTSDRERPYFVLNVRPHSVVDPLMPPGYGFAVIAEDGSVLFHSEEGLSLAESFLDEVNDRDAVRAWAASGHTVTWSGDYHGRPHRLHIQAMPQFANSNWRIVTFQESEPVLNSQLQQHKAILRMLVVNFAVLTLVALAFWLHALFTSRRLRDILLFPLSATIRGVRVLVVLVVISAGLIGWTYYPSANRHLNELYLWFFLLPLFAVGVALFSRRGAFGDKPTADTRWHDREVILLVAVMGAAPAIGFARIACRMQDTTEMERWLEAARESWDARRLRVLDRVGAPANSPKTQELLLTAGVTRNWTADDHDEPGYSYLTQIKRLKLADPTTDTDVRASATGQALVRRLLTWTPFITRDTPPEPVVKVFDRASEFQLAPRTKGTMPALGAKIDEDVGADLSLLRVVLGVLIVVGAVWAMYWARKKLLVPAFLAPQTFKESIARLSTQGTEVVLLIGPPRTRKDQAVYQKILQVAPGHEPKRIRLLDRELKDEDIDAEVKRIGGLIRVGKAPLASDGRLWLHVSNLESQLVSAESRSSVLKLLEKLTDEGDTGVSRVIIVTTSVDPVANFQEVFSEERQGIYKDVVPEVELSRSSLLLSRFRRCYLPARCELTAEERWQNWLHYVPSKWVDTVRLEAHGYEPLAEIVSEIPSRAWQTAAPSLQELSRAFTARAEAAYQLLWTSCTRSEKLVLIQLAQEGMVNPKCYEVVARLVAKGIVVTKPGLTVFNYTFRRFLRGIERGHVVAEWEHMEGTGLWVTAGRLVGSSMILGGLFFFLTQDFPVQSLLPIVSGTGLFGIPLVRDLVTRLAGGRFGATSPTA